MKHHWFTRFGWVYRPIAWQGVVVAALGVAFCIQVFLAIDRHSHSASDTLYGIFPYFCCCFLLLNWVAANTCDSEPSAQRPRNLLTKEGPTCNPG